MKTITKALVGTVAAGAVAMASAAPAMARDYDNHHGISAGEVIAGALVLGGIAAVAASASHGNYSYNDYNGYSGYNGYGANNYRYGGYGNYNRAGDPRSAVERCVSAAQQSANRYSYGRGARVTDIRDIDARRDGYRVRGRIAVNAMGRNWRSGDRYYGNGWNGDYRGWNQSYRGYDAGTFSCDVRYGRVVDLDFNGIRGLR
jgi:hypothetical protein